VLVRC